MPLIDANTFYKEVDEQKYFPIYFLFGDEPYLVQQGLSRLKTCVLPTGMEDFNLSQFHATDAEIGNVYDEVQTLPMMTSHRLVILRDAHDLKDKEWSKLTTMAADPVDSTVFVVTASKIDKRKKAIKDFIEKSHAIEFKRPYDNQIPTWISYIAKSQNVKINKEAILLLNKLIGNNLSEIHSEIQKLRDFVGEERAIEVSDVAQVVPHAKEENVFAFTKAVGKADRAGALELLAKLLEQEQSEVGIVNLLARHFRILLSLIKGQEAGLSGVKLAHYAQVNTYFLEEHLAQSRMWSEKRIMQMLVLLSDTDKAIKSSPLSAQIWLENFVLKSCN